MNLYSKKYIIKELKRITKLMNEFEFSQRCLIDLSGFNILKQLEEKEIEVDEVKEDLNDALVAKLEQEEFYEELNELIEEFDGISEFRTKKKEEEILDTLNMLEEFRDNITNFENAIEYENYKEYFKEETKKLVEDLNYIYEIIKKEYSQDRMIIETRKKAEIDALKKIMNSDNTE